MPAVPLLYAAIFVRVPGHKREKCEQIYNMVVVRTTCASLNADRHGLVCKRPHTESMTVHILRPTVGLV